MVTPVKRLVDVTVGTLVSLAALPLMVVLAIAVALTFRCSPFFTQMRVGRDGQLFRFWKFRTLPRTTHAYADKYTVQRVQIPFLARLLRATHFDELPQLFLVPLGRMSLVGPRPEMPYLHYLHAKSNPEFAEARTGVRPGCTGLWQIGAGQHRLIWEEPEYDTYYLLHCSLRLDLWIMWRTLTAMLGAGKPVSLNQIPRAVLFPVFTSRPNRFRHILRRPEDTVGPEC